MLVLRLLRVFNYFRWCRSSSRIFCRIWRTVLRVDSLSHVELLNLTFLLVFRVTRGRGRLLR